MNAAKFSVIRDALEAGMDMILAGQPVYGAEVPVSDEDSHQRFIVTIATSHLQ